MNVTIVDYQSGNISSVINSFTEVAKGKVNLEVTSDINKIKSCDKIVLPGQGSFKSCVESLNSISGLVETLTDFAITNKKPLLGICVGLQGKFLKLIIKKGNLNFRTSVGMKLKFKRKVKYLKT